MEQNKAEAATPSTTIFEEVATVIKVTPPDYSALNGDVDISQLKAVVTLRSSAFVGDWHFPIDRSRLVEFDELAAKRGTVKITIG